MENLKVLVTNEVESRDAIDMLISLGYEESCNLFDRFGFVWASDGVCGTDRISLFESYDEEKEITLLQLKDTVVLKRNSIEDATHEFQNKSKAYVSSDDICYSFSGDKWEMFTSGSSNVDLKPIKKTMKEYLDPRNGYKLIEAPESEALEPHASEWILVPEGADCYVGYNPSGLKENYWCDFHFGKINSDGFVNEMHEDYETEHYNLIDKLIERGQLLWKRHNQPEELPPIDDEKSLNEQYAEIEKVREKTVSDTLKERQSTYGSFEDVASVTQDLLSVLKRTGLESLPKPHKEALHMICSKMARIVNGDFNHIDGWHDIGGYAKLIENLIGNEDENSSKD